MSYRKALVHLNNKVSLATVNDYFATFFYFWTVDHIFKWVGFELPLKCLVQLFSSYLSSMAWQHLVGVVQRNQPCLHGHPMWGIGSSFGFVPFTTWRSSRWLQ